VEAD
jgi:uncharacterized membrane protein YtjA (UPF0391 family)